MPRNLEGIRQYIQRVHDVDPPERVVARVAAALELMGRLDRAPDGRWIARDVDALFVTALVRVPVDAWETVRVGLHVERAWITSDVDAA